MYSNSMCKGLSLDNSNTQPNDLALIETLCASEASLIDVAFGVSESLGIMALWSAIDSFTDFLRSTKPNFIPPLSIEYRTFVIKLLLAIDDRYKDVATAEVLIRGVISKKDIV